MTWLRHTYASELPSSLYSLQAPIPVEKPSMMLFNNALAKELDIEKELNDSEFKLSLLSGNQVLEGSKTIAQAYAGHQFGHFNRLGGGRAVLLGEIQVGEELLDLQLKGSGKTPYSRRGDGRATFYSMLREYVISEAMHHLGIPTTRSLSVIKTGEPVYRETANEGGVLARIAKSHIRVGTFEYARFMAEENDSEKLLNYTVKRHYPELSDSENLAIALLEKVMEKQNELIIHWLRVGFIHGVMNTDNMALSGETIDYGPCAFLNAYHSKTVFSSIDRNGRYAFSNQPNIAYWNLKVFANALLPLMDEKEDEAITKAEAVLGKFPAMFKRDYLDMMTNKLGITYHVDSDFELVQECLAILEDNKVDYTNFFTALRRGGKLMDELKELDQFNAWQSKWETARVRSSSIEESDALMTKTNPVVIARNHMVEKVLDAAVMGDIKPLHAFLDELSQPYSDSLSPQQVPVDFDAGYQTYCGT